MFVWIIAVFLACFVKGISGFGDALVMTCILNFYTAPQLITPVSTLLTLPTNMILAWQGRKTIRLRMILPVIAIMVAGDIVGALLLKHLDTGMLKVICGFVIIALGTEMLVRLQKGVSGKTHPAVLGAIGLTSGIICGLFGLGALLAAYFARVTKDSASFKGNMCTVFTVDSLFRTAVYAVTGVFTRESVTTSLILLPVLLLGLFLGMKLSSRIPEKLAKQIVCCSLILSGAALVIVNLV